MLDQKIDNLRAKLTSSPGWQGVVKAERENRPTVRIQVIGNYPSWIVAVDKTGKTR